MRAYCLLVLALSCLNKAVMNIYIADADLIFKWQKDITHKQMKPELSEKAYMYTQGYMADVLPDVWHIHI